MTNHTNRLLRTSKTRCISVSQGAKGSMTRCISVSQGVKCSMTRCISVSQGVKGSKTRCISVSQGVKGSMTRCISVSQGVKGSMNDSIHSKDTPAFKKYTNNWIFYRSLLTTVPLCLSDLLWTVHVHLSIPSGPGLVASPGKVLVYIVIARDSAFYLLLYSITLRSLSHSTLQLYNEYIHPVVKILNKFKFI